MNKEEIQINNQADINNVLDDLDAMEKGNNYDPHNPSGLDQLASKLTVARQPRFRWKKL